MNAVERQHIQYADELVKSCRAYSQEDSLDNKFDIELYGRHAL